MTSLSEPGNPGTHRVLCIVLCYNGVDDTIACLQSLRHIDYPALDVLVVDNASQDTTVAMVREHFPDVALIETGANIGFAAGNNVGLEYACDHGYDYALLLNNDTEVAPNFLGRLVEIAQSDPLVGAVGPMIYYYADPDLIWSAGGQIDWRHGTGLMIANGERDSGRLAEPYEVDYVSGCALLIRCAAIERVGLLDERFFMYYEETEWCVRIRRAGYKIMMVPAAKIWHKIPLNARFDKEYLAYYMTRNRLLFLRTTQAPLRTWLDALIFQDLRTYASLIIRPKWRKRAGRIGMRRGWIDFWRGQFGMMPQ